MKRNWDTIRKILVQFEQNSPNPMPEGITKEEFFYHVELLLDKGLIKDCKIERYTGGSMYIGDGRLTFDGHDFLDNIRIDTVWSKVKSKIARAGENVSFALIKEIASTAAKSLLEQMY